MGCLACACLWGCAQLQRFVILRSICVNGRRAASSSFVSWTQQMESGVLAAMLSESEGSSIGSPAQVATEGSRRCRAVHLSQLGPAVFRHGTVWSEEENVYKDASPADGKSFLCPRPDFFVSHSWRGRRNCRSNL